MKLEELLNVVKEEDIVILDDHTGEVYAEGSHGEFKMVEIDGDPIYEFEFYKLLDRTVLDVSISRGDLLIAIDMEDYREGRF